MIEWQRVLAPFVGLHSIAPTWPAQSLARLLEAGKKRQARLWIISTEFLIETGPNEGPRFTGT